jgi:HTH-like domain
MSKSNHTEAQRIRALKQVEAGRKVEGVARTQLVELARENPRYGYRRLHVLLGRSGEHVNHKRAHRVYREGGLMIRRKKRKHCVLPVNRCICFAAPLLSMFDHQLLAFLTNPSALHSSEPTPLCTKNNPVGSYFFFTDASRA